MRLRLASLVFLLLCTQLRCAAQQTPSTTVQRDQQALTVLSQVIKAAGGQTALAAIQDITGSGTITYYWAGEEVQGTVTLKGRGTGQFRLDANLPQGARSFVVSYGLGSVQETDGTVREISPWNIVNSGTQFFPALQIVAALADPATNISYVGLEAKNGSQVHHVRLQKFLGSPADSNGVITMPTRRDFFIDSITFQVVATRDTPRGDSGAFGGHFHEIQFSSYQQMNGVLVPLSISELGDSQITLTIQIAQMSFNSGLGDADFQVPITQQ